MHILSNEEKDKWIINYEETKTAVARKLVEDADTAIEHEQESRRTAENAGVTTRTPENTFQEMMVAIGDSLSDVPSSNNEEDGDDGDDDDTERGRLSEDDEPGWVMGNISKTVHQCMERFRQKQMKLDDLTQLGWGDTANHSCERDKKYRTTKFRVPAVVKLQTDDGSDTPAPTPFGELMECLDIVPGTLQMPQGTSQPGSSQMRLRSGKPHSKKGLACLPPDTEPNSSHIHEAKPVEPVSVHPCTLPTKLITMWISNSDDDWVTEPSS